MTPNSHVSEATMSAALVWLRASGFNHISFTTLQTTRRRAGDIYEENIVPAILAIKLDKSEKTSFPITFMIFGDEATESGGCSGYVEYQIVLVEDKQSALVDTTSLTLMGLYWDYSDYLSSEIVKNSVHTQELRYISSR